MAHTLLLADDSVTIQRVIELTFADEDVRVVAVSDGDEAIAVLDKTPPDIVLADVGMPGRNGYEVAQHIRDTPRLAHIPVMLLTGAFEPIDQAKAAAAGCDGVLAKPFEPQLVIGRVKELLARSKTKTVPASMAAPVAPPPVPAVAPPPPSLKVSGSGSATAPAPIAEPAPPVAKAVKSGDTGEYFDRLDKAFATMSTGQAEAAKGGRAAPAVADSIDWFASQPAAPPADLPLAYTPPPARAVPAPPLGSAPPPPVLPPLADAFAALLAAEQSAPAPNAAPMWPSVLPPSAPAAKVGEDVIEEVVRRVLDRLSDRVIRETVGEKVSTVAERLVRDEIARIKASIK